MPELPEVETMRRGILAVVGGVIEEVHPFESGYKPLRIEPEIPALRRRIVGRTIASVDRHGKRLALWLDSGDRLVFEPRMTGLVLLADPPNRDHLRLRLVLRGAAPQLDFWDRRGLGRLRLLTAGEFERELGPDRLGPDALSVTADELGRRLGPRRAPVKPALLDQRLLAGVGNLYASEILHRAGIHPATRCDRLTAADWQAVHQAMIVILEEAVRCEGSTLSDGTYRNALNQSGGYQSRHQVYDRAGERCPTCAKETIVRIVQAQRSTFFCPACQRAKRRSSRRR